MVSLNSPSLPQLSACSCPSSLPFNNPPYLCCLHRFHEGPTARELLWCRGEALAAFPMPAGLQQSGQPLVVHLQHHGMEQDGAIQSVPLGAAGSGAATQVQHSLREGLGLNEAPPPQLCAGCGAQLGLLRASVPLEPDSCWP